MSQWDIINSSQWTRIPWTELVINSATVFKMIMCLKPEVDFLTSQFKNRIIHHPAFLIQIHNENT